MNKEDLYAKRGNVIETKSGAAESALEIIALDAHGSGGAHHLYEIWRKKERALLSTISFQNGPIQEKGCNGVTHEALLAVIIDRFQHFQDGPFACAENADVLNLLETALDVMHRRTLRRINQGTEGKSVEVKS